MKKMLAVLLVLAMCVSLAACSGGQTQEPAVTKAPEAPPKNEAATTAPAAAEPFHINVILKNCATVYDSWLQAAAIAAAEQYDDIEIDVLDAAGDDATCINYVENAIAQKVDLIIIQKTSNFNSDDLFTEVVTKENIPIVTVNVPVDDGVSYNIPAPNYALGLAEGKLAAETLPENANVLIVRGKTVDVEQERYDGLREGMSSRSDITILDEQFAFYDQVQAMSLMEDWLQVYDDFDAVLCLSDGMALGVAEACKEFDAEFDFSTHLIYSIDGLPDSCMAIANGVIFSTIQQSADIMMAEAFKLAHGILTGEVSERKDIEIETVTITKDNVDGFIKTFTEAGYIK